MFEKWAVVKNAQGIHCRPAAVIVKEMKDAGGDLALHCRDMICDPRSIMSLLSMGLQRGDRVRVRVSGPDEKQVGSRLVNLVETRFDFPPRKQEEPTRAGTLDS
jgi:phosphocarrier protein HPr